MACWGVVLLVIAVVFFSFFTFREFRGEGQEAEGGKRNQEKGEP